MSVAPPVAVCEVLNTTDRSVLANTVPVFLITDF
jgi:hypothetical protein